MAREKIISPRQRYGEKVKSDTFPAGVSSAYIARISGINPATVRSWKSNPGAMPAYQYLRIMDALKARKGGSNEYI